MKRRTSIVAAGLLSGLLISSGLEAWRQSAFARGGPTEAEGVWLDGFTRAIALGFPVNGILALVIEPIGHVSMYLGVDPYYVLLLGIVINWTLVAWGVSRLIESRSR